MGCRAVRRRKTLARGVGQGLGIGAVGIEVVVVECSCSREMRCNLRFALFFPEFDRSIERTIFRRP